MGLYLRDERPWPRTANTVIPVCWITAGWDREKQIIENAVTQTWQKVTCISFSGWGTQTGITGPCVRLEIQEATDQQGGAQAKATGAAALRTDGVSIGFALRPTTHLDRIRYLGVHEFGHVLGLQHEDDSPDRDPGTSTNRPWAPVVQIGAWDRHPVMRSGGNVHGNKIGYLSKGDIMSIRTLYGSRDIVNQGDFLGGGACSWAVWRPSNGTWFIDDGETPPTVWGEVGDIPVPADYNGNGKTDRAVWRPSTGTWFIDDGETPPTVWGEIGDIPVPADYNGNGRTDRAVWRPSTGTWFIDDGETLPTVWGQPGDIPVPGDYDGNGRAEIAVWRPATGEWIINRLNGALNVTLGAQGDVPVQGDYLGEGHIRHVLFRPNTGEWIFWPGLRPSYFPTAVFLGRNGDIPVPGSFGGNGILEPAVWRPSSGEFIFASGWSKAWGESGDVPLPRN